MYDDDPDVRTTVYAEGRIPTTFTHLPGLVGDLQIHVAEQHVAIEDGIATMTVPATNVVALVLDVLRNLRVQELQEMSSQDLYRLFLGAGR